MRHRATGSPLGDTWVTRPANRVFDLPANRALAWVLTAIEERSIVAIPTAGPSSEWSSEIVGIGERVSRKRRVSWLASIEPSWPGDSVYADFQSDRNGFYKKSVSGAARFLRTLLFNPSVEDVTEAICQRYFEPTRDWQLYEIAVLLRICRSLGTIGEQMGRTKLLVGMTGPFASYVLASGVVVRVWYQTWPPATEPSELSDALKHYEVQSSATRPDIVVEILRGGVASSAIILELKASSSSSYLASGLGQLLGYLRDRPGLTSAPASGWLVAPKSDSFVTKEADGRSLWMVSDDEVAQRALQLAMDET